MAAAPRQMFHKVVHLPENRETERLRLCVFLFFLQEVIDNPASCCWCTWGPLSGILIRLFACSSRCCGKSGFDFGAAWGCQHHFSARFLSVGGGGVHYMILIAMRGDGDEWLNWYICFKSSKNSCPGFSFEISQIIFFFSPLCICYRFFFSFFKGEGCFGVSKHN